MSEHLFRCAVRGCHDRDGNSRHVKRGDLAATPVRRQALREPETPEWYVSLRHTANMVESMFNMISTYRSARRSWDDADGEFDGKFLEFSEAMQAYLDKNPLPVIHHPRACRIGQGAGCTYECAEHQVELYMGKDYDL